MKAKAGNAVFGEILTFLHVKKMLLQVVLAKNAAFPAIFSVSDLMARYSFTFAVRKSRNFKLKTNKSYKYG